MNYTYFQATEKDKNTIFVIYQTMMRGFVDKIWGWNDEWQQAQFDKFFPLTNITLVKSSTDYVAYSHVQEFEDMLFLRMLAVLPAHQQKGIGTKIMHDLITHANAYEKMLRLEVFKINSGVLNFYQRFGCEIVSQTPTSFVLECNAK